MSKVYDDGVIRFWLPKEWELQEIESDEDGVLRFFLNATTGHRLFVARQDWTADDDMVVDENTVLDALVADEEAKNASGKPVRLRTGFTMNCSGSLDETGFQHTCDLMAPNSPHLHLIRFMMTLSEQEWNESANRLEWFQIRHHARCSECSVGQVLTDSAPGWLKIPALAITLPEELGGLHYDFAADYESTSSGEGISLRYAGEEWLRVDLYIYGLGLDYLEDGIESEEVRGQFGSAKTDLAGSEDHEDVVLHFDGILTVSTGGDERQFLHALYRYRDSAARPDAQQVDSHIVITAHKGQFIKLRCTYPEHHADAGSEKLSQFLNDLAQVLNG